MKLLAICREFARKVLLSRPMAATIPQIALVAGFTGCVGYVFRTVSSSLQPKTGCASSCARHARSSAQFHLPAILFDAMRGFRPTAHSVHKRAPTPIGALLLFCRLDLPRQPDIKRYAMDVIRRRCRCREIYSPPLNALGQRHHRRCTCAIRVRLNHAKP